MKRRGRHLRHTACPSQTPMHSGLRIQSTQQKTAPPKSCRTTSGTMHGTPSSTKTRPRSHGKSRRHLACRWPAPTPSTTRVRFIQLKIANLKFFHTTSAITHGMKSSIITPPRNLGRPPRQVVCHWLAHTASTLNRSIQLRTANPRSFPTINATMHGTRSNITTPQRNRGKHPLQMACHWRALSPSHNLSRKRVNFNL